MKTNTPTHLRPDSKTWFTRICSEFDLEPSDLRLLQLAAESWDRKEQAREAIAKDGICVKGREGGTRPHPAVAIERDAAARFASLIKQLGLHEETEQPRMGRPSSSTLYADFNGKDQV